MNKEVVGHKHFAAPVLTKLHLLNRPVMQDCIESTRSKFWNILILSLISLAIACIPIRPTAAGQSKPKNVIVVFSGLSSREDEQEILAVIESSVRTHAQNETNYFPIDLDYQRAEDKSYCESLAETLRREYKAIKPDVVIASGAPELQFTTQYRDKIFPGVPIVFSMVTASELESLKRSRFQMSATFVVRTESTAGCLALRPHE